MDNLLLPKATLEYAKNIEPSSSITSDFITDKPVTDIRPGILDIDIPI
jgi:hypothetical protein